ncbi:MAG: ABC transporter ATP-binding protein/permease, partial [Firmicutes bacterium]|nr:ABC transporter ATP-binding protein/permease [Bacillota bacterium]
YPDAYAGLQRIALLFLAVLVAGFAFQYTQILLMQLVGQQAMFDLRMQIFRHLQRLPMRFFDRNPVGRLVTRVTTDVDTLNELFASGVVAMVGDIFRVVFIVAAMIWMDWRLTLAALSILPLLVLATLLFRRSFRDANRRIRVAIARINAFLNEHITGMSVVQLFNRERTARERFARINRQHLEAFKDAIRAHAIFYPTVEIVGVLAIVLLLWFGGVRVLDTTQAALIGRPLPAAPLAAGELVAFITWVGMFFRPIQDLGEKYAILQAAMASSERIFRLLDEPADPPASARRRALFSPRGEIEFRNVWFRYTAPSPDHSEDPEADGWVLRDISFRAEPGQTLALVGHTGAGKTTITSLLLRFYEIQRGAILLDGVDIRDLDPEELRRHFGVVLQDPFLFTGTLETNVRLGSSIPCVQVQRALEEVRLGALLRAHPEGLDAPVTERGATFSVGQRQLISFARALAHDPRFLILDEATSSVDTQTEVLIREALDRLLTGRTAIVIAHRLSTIQRADRILVLHKGRLREQGTHQQLLAQRGIYYRLYQLQYKDQELRLPLTAGDTPAGASLPADD